MSDKMAQLTARCLCRAHTYTASVPASSLPLSVNSCHCNSCRHQLGALYASDVKWPNKDEDISSLERYSFTKNLDFFFCKTCGSNMFAKGTKPNSTPSVATGVLDNTPGLLRYDHHIFVGDTVDGGVSPWLRSHTDGAPAKRWLQGNWGPGPDEELAPDWPTEYTAPDIGAVAFPEFTPIRCHCRGVDLLLRSAVDMAGIPDAELPFHVEPKSLKYLAIMDACADCRAWTGPDIMSWTFAKISYIHFPGSGADTKFPANTLPQDVAGLKEAVTRDDRDPRLGTLAMYKSSPDVERYYCSRCAASVFFAVASRPDIVDIAVGLLEHPSGARAEGLLVWNLGRMSWKWSPKGGWREDLANNVDELMEEWRIQHRYPKTTARINGERREKEKSEKEEEKEKEKEKEKKEKEKEEKEKEGKRKGETGKDEPSSLESAVANISI